MRRHRYIYILRALAVFTIAWLLLLFFRAPLSNTYAHHGIRFKYWWKTLPKDEGFYRATTETTAAVDPASRPLSQVDHPLETTCHPSYVETHYLDFSPCKEIDGVSFPLCAVFNAARNGSGPGLPQPSLGSRETLGLPSDECLDRTGRWSAYGHEVNDNEAFSSERDIPVPPWEDLDLDGIQKRCWAMSGRRSRLNEGIDPVKPRTAIVLRAWDSCVWTKDAIRNIRALVMESSLTLGGEFQVFVLMHVRSESTAVEYAGRMPELLEKLHVPKEFRNMTEVWSYLDTKEAYPNVGAYDVFFHTYMPVQLFAMRHPEFEYFWNWELDVRYIGHYGQLLRRLSQWSREQRMDDLRNRNGRFYVPSFPESYGNFAKGPYRHVTTDEPARQVGLGEEADLITLLPLFNVNNTNWVYRNYLINYSFEDKLKPRQASIVLTGRLSRRLLMKMHHENQDSGHAMAAEMWPATIALESGFKAVYVPHPIYMERLWPADILQAVFNAGPNAEVGGSLSGVINHEHNFEGSTWYYSNSFAPNIYHRWMGLATNGPGSDKWERKHGRMCLPAMLLHPIKPNAYKGIT